MPAVSDEFARLLRSFRDRADAPSTKASTQASTQAPRSRRAPGLRREELAQAANVSVDYVIRLEQGRSLRPSAVVVDAIAHALRLDREETSTLYRAAGLAPPSRVVVRDLDEGLQRFLERVRDERRYGVSA